MMVPSLLAIKTQIPLPPPQLVARIGLIDDLEREIPYYKLTLVSAPAGYGKSTLLTQWAHSSRLCVAWFSLSEEDNEFARFFRYLLAAWKNVQPDVMESPLATLLSGMAPHSEAVLPAFVNLASDLSSHTVFVLDDYHLIQEPSIHEALRFLLDHLPQKLHFVLAGRAAPPLPLARYRARRELMELGVEELSFLPEETADFLNERMGLELADAEIQRIQTQLEGWIAGLQLAALTLRRGLTGVDKVALGGRHRFIADYLSEDVLAHLPDETQEFLLQTSILDRVCGALATAVTGHPSAQERLETLERANLFLIPLDDKRAWFRYHHLFADFLREQLKQRYPDEVADLHQRAAHWYLAQEMPEPAFHHAIAAPAADVVAQIGERYFETMLHSGQLKLLKQWLDAIPAEWHFRYPVIGLAQASWLALIGSVEACIDAIDAIQQNLVQTERADKRWQLARVNTLRCQIACFQNDLARAEPIASRALDDLPQSDHHFRANIHHSLGDAYRYVGRWQEAREQYLIVLDLVHDPSFQFRSVHVYGALADLELRQGRLRQAYTDWGEAQAVIEAQANWGRFSLPLMGWVTLRMGEIEYEWNELDTAHAHLARGLEQAELGGDVRATAAGHILLGRLQLTTGDLVAAGEHLAQARPLVENFSDWHGRFQRLQLEFWLAQDKLPAAIQWADETLNEEALGEQPEREAAQLALARVFIVKGEGPALQQALALLPKLAQTAKAEGRQRIHIEALALTALARWQRRDRAGALTALNHALRLAEPEGYVRLFADLGLPMARLLQEAQSRHVRPKYTDELLAACGEIADLAGESLPEPLTPREQEVLALLAAGLTNHEIADNLVISPQTVKKHAGSIYRKLAVRGRTEAAARARELDLLA